MKADKVILGENCIYSTDCSETGINNNIIVCGGSGSGKTMSVSEPRIIESHSTSLVAAVTKRRIINKYKGLLEKRGYKVLDLDFAVPSRGNTGYDPLNYVKSYGDISYLAKSVVMSDKRKETAVSDPYWQESAVSLLSAEIACTMMKNKKASFADVLDMHSSLDFKEDNNGISTSLDSTFRELAAKNPSCFAINCWNTFRRLPIRTASCIYSELNTVVDTLFSPDLRKMMRMKNSVDIKQLGSERTALFITVSPVNRASEFFANMFYGSVFKELFEFAEAQPNGILPVPVHVLCDDFAAGSRIHNFEDHISVFREKGISVTMLLQSESQLEAMYGAAGATTIINNCDSYIYLGGMDLKTANNVSIRLNVPLDEVLYMPVGKEVLFRRGQRPIVADRYDIRKNETYREVTKEYEDEISSS